MRPLKQFVASFIKNIKRMFKSPLTLGVIFLGPFLIILMLQGVYQTTDNISLNIGISKEGSESYSYLMNVFDKRGFKIYEYETTEECNYHIKRSYIDLCAEFGEENKVIFYVDKSKINLVTVLRMVIAEAMDDQSKAVRERVADDLKNELGGTTDVVDGIKQNFDLFMQKRPSDTLLELATGIEQGKVDMGKAISDLDSMKAQTQQVYSRTQSDLDSFGSDLSEAEKSARMQLNTITDIEYYNRDCESMINPDDIYLQYSADFEEVKQTYIDYGKCKCVDFYRENLIDIKRDLMEVIESIEDAKYSVSTAKQRNNDFYNTVTSTIDEQRIALSDNMNSATVMATNLRLRAAEVDKDLDSFSESIDSMRSQTEELEKHTDILKKNMVDPFSIEIKPIGEDKDLIVYLFPMMYFFILSFVAMIFSATFIQSERTSKALLRNLLSPSSKFITLLAIFISLLFLVMMQSFMLILLGTIVFGFPFSMGIFMTLLMITCIVLIFFIVIGLLIGTLFNSTLLITFTSIGLSILSFLYSSSISPTNAMTEFARALVLVNPYEIGVKSISQVILYDIPFSSFYSSLFSVFIVSAVIFLCLYFIFRAKHES